MRPRHARLWYVAVLSAGFATLVPGVGAAMPLFSEVVGCHDHVYPCLAVDLDSDGRPDLVSMVDDSHTIPTIGLGKLFVAMNRGDGVFPAISQVPLASDVRLLAGGDFDGDGHADLLVRIG